MTTGSRVNAFNLETCARPNILALQPYRCARDDYKDDGTNILLDANENAYGPGLALEGNGKLRNGVYGMEDNIEVDFLGLNRYPDPHQIPLKERLCDLRNTNHHTQTELRPDNLFVGVGSDEAIDALLRAFCVPGKDKILTCPPTYGMYSVSAQTNDVGIVKVPLIASQDFALDAPAINEVLSGPEGANIKLVYICSPGNPTGALVSKSAVEQVLTHPTWNGIVIVDEAYVDFAAEDASLAQWTTEWPNLVVMQTLSKAFGLAGIRLGAAFTSPPIARILNSLKAPYNISNPTSQIALQALKPRHLGVMHKNRDAILQQRSRLLQEMPQVPGVGRFLGGQDANFLLVEFLSAPKEEGGKPDNEVALKVYEALAEEKGVVVRFRGKELGCTGCLRVTVGTENECTRFLDSLYQVLSSIYAGKKTTNGTNEEQREQAASNVIA
ncbi:Histidinol-phosphate aminotransferase [Lasiodiplodia hormozganensis]|uniref:histidinol-phosphate transaminase n=1 Tax=Lasiodiplodia hormozganensis TaxID=869390 RepID=A0AA39YIN1_9PEZI|nr:Histidinol-phosphate aminotransferase [Lasiodiplodia hormozganensis]